MAPFDSVCSGGLVPVPSDRYKRYHASAPHGTIRPLQRYHWGDILSMRFDELYGKELGTGYIEVHHLQMISTFDDQRPDDYVANLVPLCANCHAMIHRGPDGPLTLAQLRAAYRGPRSPLAKTKEDI